MRFSLRVWLLATSSVALGLRNVRCGRRTWLAVASGGISGSSQVVSAAFSKPLVDVAIERLHLPEGGFGRDYVIVPVELPNGDSQEFMLDSGLTLELVTPELKKQLQSGSAMGSSAGSTRGYDVFELRGASIAGLRLPNLHATVADFPMAHIDPEHDVKGMLGLEFLQAFDVDLDVPRRRLRLYRPGEGAAVAKAAGMTAIPAKIVNGAVLCVRLARDQAATGPAQPFIAVVDCGASFSTLSAEAARLAEVTTDDEGDSGFVTALGLDNKPFKLPLVRANLEFAGDYESGRFKTAAKLPRDLRVAVGDLPVFTEVLGERLGKSAALIGMDVWSKGRTIFLGKAETDAPRTLYWKQQEQ